MLLWEPELFFSEYENVEQVVQEPPFSPELYSSNISMLICAFVDTFQAKEFVYLVSVKK